MKLLGPKTQVSRPITDRVKESLFSVLYKYDLPDGAIAADLFSGVGSLGLEALSRGAEFVTFVERDPRIISVLSKNIEKAGLVKESKVIRANAYKIGAPVDSGRQKYNLVFIDPPYADTIDVRNDSPLGGLLDLLGGQVTEEGIVIVRTGERVSLLEQYGEFQIIERRKWGTMIVNILRKTSE